MLKQLYIVCDDFTYGEKLLTRMKESFYFAALRNVFFAETAAAKGFCFWFVYII